MTAQEKIDQALKQHAPFIFAVRANALLHDADKLSSLFLEWSVRQKRDNNEKNVVCYPGHNGGKAERGDWRQANLVSNCIS